MPAAAPNPPRRRRRGSPVPMYGGLLAVAQQPKPPKPLIKLEKRRKDPTDLAESRATSPSSLTGGVSTPSTGLSVGRAAPSTAPHQCSPLHIPSIWRKKSAKTVQSLSPPSTPTKEWVQGSLRAPVAPALDVDEVAVRPCPNFGSSPKPWLLHQAVRRVSTKTAALAPHSDDDAVTFSEMYSKSSLSSDSITDSGIGRGESRSSLDDECYTDDVYPQRVSAFLSPMEFRPPSISTAFIILSETNLSDADSDAEEALETPQLDTPSSSLPSLDPVHHDNSTRSASS
ncbi:hypothetical protein DFH08DRAFT_871242 [Mycena albidolilacea]|uniref:Uncharacterized protein n=1 Tax=Mycena albidolilacea TaxID=1033008 RepID=A0AAD7EPA8_9AGAR|nr:hypothetical protein DFH08DRAFT_871242 [Mycena albidolilacea]